MAVKSAVFAALPTLADQRAVPCASPKPSRLDRLDHRIEHKRRYGLAQTVFRRDVIQRDGYVCRCCQRRVVRARTLVEDRLEVHHLHGRVGMFRFLARCAIVLCFRCHSRVTGAVNDKLLVHGTRFFVAENGQRCIDAGTRTPIPVRFVEAP